MKESGVDVALLVPANPLLGRVIRDGKYYVRGKPIDQTEFARDPEYPRKSSSVKELLGPSGSFNVQVIRWPTPIPESGIVVGEAGAQLDLQRWAASHNAKMVAAGGAEYFATLLAAGGHKAAGGSAKTEGSREETQLFVCGSASESACAFARDAQAQGSPVVSLPDSLASGGALGEDQVNEVTAKVSEALKLKRRAILNIGLPVVSDKAVAARLLNELGAVAEKVLRTGGVEHVFAEGGSTAAELVRRMGWTRLKVVREEARGVVTLAPEGAGELLLTMKPGSYVWPSGIRAG
jgi:uncharacterized protein YgbK (DUF1537 family)